MGGHDIVVDGRERALAGAKAAIARTRRQIKTDVNAEYSRQWEDAGFFRKIHLWLKIRSEIRRRVAAEVEEIAPRGGLYLKNTE